MQRTLFDKLHEIMPSLSKGHKKIAEYMLSHYDKAAFMTASKLGTIVGVSESTVVRFATELGFEGYPELQRALKEFTSNKLTTVQRIDVMNDQLGDVDVKLIHTTSTSEMFEQIINIGENDIMIGISFPRYSKHTVKAFRYAHAHNAKVIAITDSLASPLAEYADNILIARSDMASFADSLVAPMSVINALIVAVGLRKRDYVAYNYSRLEDICEEYEVFESSDDKDYDLTPEQRQSPHEIEV